MAVSLNGTNGITFNDSSTQNTAATGFGFKNRIINGAMGIWQRGTSSTALNTYGAADRWYQTATSGTWSQSTDVPSGFKYSLSVNGSSYPQATQRIESVNCTDLVGQSVTISFWLKQTSGAGANSIGLILYYANTADTFSSTTQIGSQVNISATSSWVQYTATFSSLPSGTANGLQLTIFANTGSSATYLITGVQLEKGSTATSFDYRPYGTELALCQRYYETSTVYVIANTSAYTPFVFPYTTKRAAPTVTTPSMPSTVSGSNSGVNNYSGYFNLSVLGSAIVTATVSAEL